MRAVALIVAIPALALTFALSVFERFIAFAFGAIEQRWQPMIEGFGGFMLPSPAGHPISSALYQRNRHEAHSHSRAAHRGL